VRSGVNLGFSQGDNELHKGIPADIAAIAMGFKETAAAVTATSSAVRRRVVRNQMVP